MIFYWYGTFHAGVRLRLHHLHGRQVLLQVLAPFLFSVVLMNDPPPEKADDSVSMSLKPRAMRAVHLLVASDPLIHDGRHQISFLGSLVEVGAAAPLKHSYSLKGQLHSVLGHVPIGHRFGMTVQEEGEAVKDHYGGQHRAAAHRHLVVVLDPASHPTLQSPP